MDKHKILNSPAFSKLVKNRWAFSLSMAVLTLLVYFGFILTIAFKKDFLATPLDGKLSLGIPIGIGIIFFSWILTGIYVWWANRYYDKQVNNIKKQHLN